jgi:hypothetical protein
VQRLLSPHHQKGMDMVIDFTNGAGAIGSDLQRSRVWRDALTVYPPG